ncbi:MULTISPECIES: MlaD family protein [unclassified Streptomyces]|uniref:MlaD family protein n=1 Tax=unclassified Streptomyces TaxID=2593676 RepID=UPI000DB95235|nr:MlaD family protein [Streptomyces sp. PsTaAH-137]MYT70866.1 MCE family protein [Streptomyces sp. SID8367]RAJ90572.1 phospholipid/cholesterol/gamma-HCH transport system substrate-binding protein [Streptomyces sp. PsTaAH-137]
MITLAIRLKNLAFLLIAVLVLGYLGIRYADLGRYVGAADYYTVKVQLPRTGGLFTHSDVTYRGVSVGRVGAINLTGDGVEADLRIKKSAPEIPDDAKAVVASLSAVGEQYIDLRPDRSDGPYLANGDRIDRTASSVPKPVTDVLSSVDDLTTSVPLDDLRTVVDEFGKAFEGRGEDLQLLMDNGSQFVQAADKALPETTKLMNDGEVVLRTQAQEGDAIKSFASGASQLASTLKGSDADLRRLVMAAPDAATRISGLLRDLNPEVGVVLANLLTTSEVAVTRQRGTEELLVKLPAAVAAGATAVDGKKVNFGMAVTFFKPLPCTAGYSGTTYRLGTDLSAAPATNTGARCTAPASSGVNVRGSAHAPGGGAVPKPAQPGALSLPSVADDSGTSASSSGMAGLLGLSEGSGR